MLKHPCEKFIIRYIFSTKVLFANYEGLMHNHLVICALLSITVVLLSITMEIF